MTDTELTRLLAERVMGWKIKAPDYIDQVGWLWRWKGDRIQQPWRPLGSMDDAWMVVEKMREQGHHIDIGSTVRGSIEDARAGLKTPMWHVSIRGSRFEAREFTCQRALCLATLRCVGVEV